MIYFSFAEGHGPKRIFLDGPGSHRMRDMMFTLDLSGRNDYGEPEIVRFGGLLSSIDDAVSHGQEEAAGGRLVFKAETIWVRNQTGHVVSETAA